MKKRFLFLLASLLFMVAGMQNAWGQKMIVTMTDNSTLRLDVKKVRDITFMEEKPIGDLEYVDLGLPSGTLWATFNIGATRPEEVGDFFAWGETEPKDTYNWATYKHCNGSSTSFTKYCTNDYYGTVDGKTKLEPADDAATANWGKTWSMPTQEHYRELVNSDYTTCIKTTQEGVSGLKITSKKNGNSIFLPMGGGYRASSSSYNTDYGYYWMSDLFAGIDNLAYSFSINWGFGPGDSKDRACGLNIRPVRKTHEYVDLGLESGTLWATCNVGANSPEEFGDYFAWGETEPKSDYSWETYKWCMGSLDMLTKYSVRFYEDQENYGYNGFEDNIHELLPEDDAATVNWGEDWRMANIGDYEELVRSEFTEWEWTTQNGVYGLKVTSLVNSNSLFLPAAGLRSRTTLDFDGEKGYYWGPYVGGILDGLKPFNAQPFVFDYQEVDWETAYEYRCVGMPVRPVRKQ